MINTLSITFKNTKYNIIKYSISKSNNLSKGIIIYRIYTVRSFRIKSKNNKPINPMTLRPRDDVNQDLSFPLKGFNFFYFL